MVITKQSFAKLSFVSIGNFVNAVLGFAFLAVVAKQLDVQTFGKYAMISSLLVFSSKIMDFGTNSLYVAKTIKDEKQSDTDTFFLTKITLFVVSLPISFLALFFSKLLQPTLVVIFVGGLIAYGINYTLYAFFQRQERYIELVLLNLLPALIKGAFAILIFANILHITMNTAFLIFAFSIFSGVILSGRVKKQVHLSTKNFTVVKSSLIKAISPGTSQLVYEGWQTFNNFIANFINGYVNVGIFSLAAKISNIFSMISFSIFTVLLPKNAARKANKLKYNFGETAFVGFGIILLSVISMFVSKLLLQEFFGAKFQESFALLNILILSSAISSVQNFSENYFYVEELTHMLIRVNVLKLVGLIGLALAFTPYLGLKGLAFSNLIVSISGLAYVVTQMVKREKMN